MGIFDKFGESLLKIGDKYINIDGLCDEDKVKLEKKLGLVRATLDRNGKQVYAVTDNYTAVSDLLYHSDRTMQNLRNNLVYLDNTPVLDKYGVMREANALSDKVIIAKDLKQENIENDDRRMIKILAKYSMYSTSTSSKIRLRSLRSNETPDKYCIQLTNGKYAKIYLDDNIFEVKRYDGIAFYKAVNNTGRPIYVMMHGGIRGGGNREHIWPEKIEPNQVFLAEEKSLLDVEHDNVGKEAFDAHVHKNMTVLLNTKGANSAMNYMASNERYRDVDDIKGKYSNGRVYTGISGKLIASRPFDINDIDLLRRDLYRNLYLSVMKQIVPNYTEEYDVTYRLTHKLVNDRDDTLGYRATKISCIYGQSNCIDIQLNDVFNLVNSNKVTNATIVVSENKRPYIRCDKELPKVVMNI